MKKILTIVALTLVLCLGISAALAAITYDGLHDNQKADIVNKLMKAGTLKDSTEIETQKGNLNFKEEDGKVSWTFKGSDAEGIVLSCEEGKHAYGATTYTYYEWNAAKKAVNEKATESAAKPADVTAYTHYGDVCAVKVCTICGHKDVQTLAKKVDHHYTADYSFSTTDPSKVAPVVVVIADKDELKAWPCQAANKGKNLYKYRQCDDCNYIESALVYKEAAGAHKLSSAVQVIEESTCMTHGYKAKKCTVCGWVDKANKIDLPLAAHTYTEKYYEFKADASKTPSCKTGLVFVYTNKCKWFDKCGQYEGDLVKPDFVKYGHTETMSLEKAAKLLGWEDDEVNKVKLYDADGHHYTLAVEPETGASTYACEAGYKWTYACNTCGKKLVITNGEEKPEFEKKDIDASKTKVIDCTHVTVTYKCDYCEGKVAGHTKSEDVELKNTDALAHNSGKYFVEDLSKRVEPTCGKDGSQTLVCTECGYEKVVVLPSTGTHSYGAWALVKVNEKDPGNEYVWERACVTCGKTEIRTTTTKEAPKTDKWEKTDDKFAGNCLEASYVVYKHVGADGKDIKVGDKVETKKVYGAYGEHVLSKVENYKGEKKATCAAEGIELWICARCTNYNPETPKAKVLADYMTYRGSLPGGTPYYVVKKTEKIAHTWGEPVVVEATAEKDGSITKTCTVCGEVETTVVPFEKADAAYTLADVKFDGELLTGKLVHKEGTKDADKLTVRVTFYMSGNTYFVVAAPVDEDLTFEAQGAGVIEYITMAVYASNKVVNPADVANLTMLDAAEYEVK